MQRNERASMTDFMKNLSEPMPLDQKVALLIRNNAVKVYTFDRRGRADQAGALQPEDNKPVK